MPTIKVSPVSQSLWDVMGDRGVLVWFNAGTHAIVIWNQQNTMTVYRVHADGYHYVDARVLESAPESVSQARQEADLYLRELSWDLPDVIWPVNFVSRFRLGQEAHVITYNVGRGWIHLPEGTKGHTFTVCGVEFKTGLDKEPEVLVRVYPSPSAATGSLFRERDCFHTFAEAEEAVATRGAP